MGDDPRFIFAMWAFIVVGSILLVWAALTQPLPWVP